MKKRLACILSTLTFIPLNSCAAPEPEVGPVEGWCQIALPIITDVRQPLDPNFIASARRGKVYGIRRQESANIAFAVESADKCAGPLLQFADVELAYVGSPLEERRNDGAKLTVCDSGTILVNQLIDKPEFQGSGSEISPTGGIPNLLAGFGVRWPDITGASNRPAGLFYELQTFNDCEYATTVLMSLKNHFKVE